MTVSSLALALALHVLLFVPPCLFHPSYLYPYLRSFVCLGGQFNEHNASQAD